MNPFTYMEQFAGAIAQHPALALLIALVGGVLSTST